MKEITITVPDNCELKQDDNTYTIVEKEKKLTYNDVAKELFKYKNISFISSDGVINSFRCIDHYHYSNNCTSRRQAEKLLAINKLMNVAKYLNGVWQPDWDDRYENKYFIFIDNKIRIGHTSATRSCDVYFKYEELAKQAIKILGEETIKLALCTDY